MAKRTRGARSSRPRPNQPRPSRPTATAAATPQAAPAAASATLTAPATPAAAPAIERATVRPARAARTGGILAARTADEYVYVSRDLRRIAIVGGSMFGIMAVLWLVVDVAKLVKL